MPSIVALLPAYNEEVSIGSVVLRTKQYADRVVVIDDGSRGRTAEVAAMAGSEVLRHSRNQGKGAALKTGFGSVNGDSVIVTIDTDGQHNPDDIPRLVEPILSGEADMVFDCFNWRFGREEPCAIKIGQSELSSQPLMKSC